ncbi:hypothetical protein [Deinococcus saxicola]|uniref:hypothetical protein n=1 Tax=Deinococcus saxicola TaxID=249406 RepID=UPI0039EE1D81
MTLIQRHTDEGQRESPRRPVPAGAKLAAEQYRAHVHDLCLEAQEVTGVNIEVLFDAQEYTGKTAASDATEMRGESVVVKRPESIKGLI